MKTISGIKIVILTLRTLAIAWLWSAELLMADECSKASFEKKENLNLDVMTTAMRTNADKDHHDLGLVPLQMFGKLLFVPNRYFFSFSNERIQLIGYNRSAHFSCLNGGELVLLRGQIEIGGREKCDVCDFETKAENSNVNLSLVGRSGNVVVKEIRDEKHVVLGGVIYDDKTFIYLIDDNKALHLKLFDQITSQTKGRENP